MRRVEKNSKRNTVREEALHLVRDPNFLYRVGLKIAELGVVGERRNIQTLVLAGISKDSEDPVSVIVKGSSASGKSQIIRRALMVFPPESVITLASVSGQAPVYSGQPLSGRILYLLEYRGAKDARYLIRQQQSEGIITREVAWRDGRERGTDVLIREGSPVVLTTTTASRVMEDDETRFLSVASDGSAELTLQILRSAITPTGSTSDQPRLEIWHEAFRLLSSRKPKFEYPRWLDYVARKLPLEKVRARRDWSRFLTLLKVIARIRGMANDVDERTPLRIEFSDYCVAYAILNVAFASTSLSLPAQEVQIAQAVRRIYGRTRNPVVVKDLAAELRWKVEMVYKWLPEAVKDKLVTYEGPSREHNLKLIVPVPGQASGFLPSPGLVWANNKDIGDRAEHIDPLTGEKRCFK